jgi:peptidyl-dipeptidase Dcp
MLNAIIFKRMKKISLLFTLLLLILAACNTNSERNKSMGNKKYLASNPFMHASTLPFQAPDFTKITSSDFEPAFEEGIKEELADIKRIAENKEVPTFENTLVELEKSGELLHRVNAVFNMLSGANTDSVLQKLSEDIAPKLASIQDAIFLNDKLFERVKSIYNKKNELKLDAESAWLLQYYYDEFTRAGANLSKEDKEKLTKLNAEEAGLGAKFTNQLLAAAKAAAFVVDNKEALKGLSEGDLKSAAQNAEANGKKGK